MYKLVARVCPSTIPKRLVIMKLTFYVNNQERRVLSTFSNSIYNTTLEPLHCTNNNNLPHPSIKIYYFYFYLFTFYNDHNYILLRIKGKLQLAALIELTVSGYNCYRYQVVLYNFS